VLLAQHGVRCLDEPPEFRRQVLAVLRQPLEDRVTYL
jgi:predicted ATPase with chaperone activity